MSEAATLADALRLAGGGDAGAGGERAANPDWILLDLMLPDGSGTELLRRVRSGAIASKVCVVTGCAAGVLSEVRALGPEHVFTKPLNVEGLLTVLVN